MPRGGGGASHGTLVPLHQPILGFFASFFTQEVPELLGVLRNFKGEV